MPAPIVTLVEGTPGSCRATARELGDLRAGEHDLGTGLFRVRGESESCWEGEAGDNFRQSMTEKGNAGTDVDEATGRMKVALETFADKLHTVISRMNQARSLAAEHGLSLTPDAIEPPGPRPPDPSLEPTPEQSTQLQVSKPLDQYRAEAAAMAEYNRKVAGFEQAKVVVDEARKIEAEAHMALEQAMKYDKDLVSALLANAHWSMEGVARGMVTTPQSLADTFAKEADRLFQKAAQQPGVVDAAGLTPAQRASRTALLRQAAKTRAASMKAQSIANRLYSRSPISADDARILGKTVKGVPVVGTAISVGLETQAVLNSGKPVEEATGSLIGGVGLGSLSGAVAAGMVTGGPVGVLVVVGASAAGAGVGSYLGENVADQMSGG